MSDFTTQWGVKSTWGCTALGSYQEAVKQVTNMRAAGHKASIIWRGVTEWHHNINDERAMQPVEGQ